MGPPPGRPPCLVPLQAALGAAGRRCVRDLLATGAPGSGLGGFRGPGSTERSRDSACTGASPSRLLPRPLAGPRAAAARAAPGSPGCLPRSTYTPNAVQFRRRVSPCFSDLVAAGGTQEDDAGDHTRTELDRSVSSKTTPFRGAL